MKRSLAIVAAILGVLWIAATGVLLFYVADLAPIQALLIAFVAMDGAFLALLALLLVTNTRASWATSDPYAQTTDALLRPAVLIGDRPYGRRAQDDRHVVERLIDRLEKDDDKRPAPATTPQWALDLQQANGAPEPMEEP